MNFSEQLIASALQKQGYFVIQGLKVGVREADYLTIRRIGNNYEFAHIEAQVSYNPIGVLRAKAGFGKPAKNSKQAAREFIEKKFFNKDLCKEITNIFGTNKYKKIFIYGRLKDVSQLEVFDNKGIECRSLSDLMNLAEKSEHKIGAFTDYVEIAKIYKREQ